MNLEERENLLLGDIKKIQDALKAFRDEEANMIAKFHRVSGHLSEVQYQRGISEVSKVEDCTDGQVNVQETE